MCLLGLISVRAGVRYLDGDLFLYSENHQSTGIFSLNKRVWEVGGGVDGSKR